MVLSISQRLFVSIHAPAWGATPRPLTGFLRHKSFNPRTLVGCDWRPCWAFPSASRFQSTHPRGVRRRTCQPQICRRLFQSTHPRGVRLPVMRRRFQPHHVSIHAPAWGATCHARQGPALQMRFQSTHPRGVRLGRLRSGRIPGTVSIHAPAWGATPLTDWMPVCVILFQSTHPRGVRPQHRWPEPQPS